MRAAFSLVYGLVAYVAFLVAFAAVAISTFGVGIPGVPLVDGLPHRAAPEALAVDLGLVFLFGLQHSVMARPRFKNAMARVLPVQLERSTFVLASAVFLGFAVILWQPIAGEVWNVQTPAGSLLLRGLSAAGYGLVVIASFVFDHFELFGLKQVWAGARGRECEAPAFRTPALYRVVRHPMMLGILVGVWASPRMTLGHAAFAGSLSLYILVGVYFEERDMARRFGDVYGEYRAGVPMLLPFPRPAGRKGIRAEPAMNAARSS